MKTKWNEKSVTALFSWNWKLVIFFLRFTLCVSVMTSFIRVLWKLDFWDSESPIGSHKMEKIESSILVLRGSTYFSSSCNQKLTSDVRPPTTCTFCGFHLLYEFEMLSCIVASMFQSIFLAMNENFPIQSQLQSDTHFNKKLFIFYSFIQVNSQKHKRWALISKSKVWRRNPLSIMQGTTSRS